jgi:hypothetical protein
MFDRTWTNIVWKGSTKLGCAYEAVREVIPTSPPYVQPSWSYICLYSAKGSTGDAENFRRNVGPPAPQEFVNIYMLQRHRAIHTQQDYYYGQQRALDRNATLESLALKVVPLIAKGTAPDQLGLPADVGFNAATTAYAPGTTKSAVESAPEVVDRWMSTQSGCE